MTDAERAGMDRVWMGSTRRLRPEHRTAALRAASIMFLVDGAAALAVGVSELGRSAAAHPGGVVAAGLTAMVVGGFGLIFPAFVSDETMDRLQAVVAFAVILGAGIIITIGVYAAGPAYSFGLAAYPVAPIFAFYLLKRRLAYFLLLALGIELALVFSLQPGWHGGPFIWLFIVVLVVSTGFLTGTLMGRMDELTVSEQQAREELAEVNTDLQGTVERQVEELGQLGRLRSFLSPQIADVVSSRGSEDLLAPHRREIAVFFCDLRGWTNFSFSEAPEDVLKVLDEYYGVVCATLDHHNATIGTFNGDGVMAFLNDPLPCDDPPATAVAMALAMQDDLAALRERWKGRGFTLGYGIGIAHGYATIGLIGTEQRSDYTAVGPVVNLASRLCDEAADGQILIDQRSRTALGDSVPSEPMGSVTLKGFPNEMPIFSVQPPG